MEMKPYEHKTQYYETDQMGIIHHSNYIRWFEEARTYMMEQMGMGYDVMEAQGIIIPVLSVRCEYKSMTHFGDRVIIEVKLISFNGIKYALSYVMRDEKSGEVRATGTSRHCYLNKNGRPVTIKKELPALYEKMKEAMAAGQEEQV